MSLYISPSYTLLKIITGLPDSDIATIGFRRVDPKSYGKRQLLLPK